MKGLESHMQVMKIMGDPRHNLLEDEVQSASYYTNMQWK